MKTPSDWNKLPDSVLCAKTLDFKTAVQQLLLTAAKFPELEFCRVLYPDNLGEENVLVNISISKGGLKHQRVMLSDMPNWGKGGWGSGGGGVGGGVEGTRSFVCIVNDHSYV